MLSFITILNPVKTCTSFQNINLCKRASLYYKPRSRKTYSSFSQNISTKKTYSTLDLTHTFMVLKRAGSFSQLDLKSRNCKVPQSNFEIKLQMILYIAFCFSYLHCFALVQNLNDLKKKQI